MTLKLRIRPPLGRDAAAVEKTFEQDEISIGRDKNNTLPLESRHVSSFHARISHGFDAYEIEDRKSTNVTLVNEEPLIPEKKYPLRLGDRVRIGDHVIEVVSIDHRPRSPEAPPAAAVESPLPSGRLPGPDVSFDQLADEFAEQISRLGRLHLEKAVKCWSQFPDQGPGGPEGADAAFLRQENERLKSENTQLKDMIRRHEEHRSTAEMSSALPVRQPSDDRKMDVLQLFFGAASRLCRGRMSFLTEFAEDSMAWDRESTMLLNDKEDEFVRALLDPRLTDEQVRSGMERLKGELGELVAHSLGMVQGYRSSTFTGARAILAHVDPAHVRRLLEKQETRERELQRGGPFVHLVSGLPFLRGLEARWFAWKRLNELLREDRGVMEKRYFRQAFVQAYKESVRSGPGKEDL